ncbi:MAG: regulatory protein RecX [Gemmatimonadales bacterium]|nr:MAG: regulatory protein RecX [Gemmatimonadales bacterium]
MTPTDSKLRDKAHRLLSQREHSRSELRQKLLERGSAEGPVDELLDHLRDTGLQSDRRFAEALARSRVARGYGPLRIRSDLARRGVAPPLARQVLDALAVDWAEALREEHASRFGDDAPPNFQEKARRWRALERRGFTVAQLRDFLG